VNELAVIPDSIEPVEAFRCWTLRDGKLRSLNGGGKGETWKPGEHLEATCNAEVGQHKWTVVRRGMSYQDAMTHTERRNQSTRDSLSSVSFSGLGVHRAYWIPAPPKLELPLGYGFECVCESHSAPDKDCTCGIYAAMTEKGVPQGGNVYGKVKLWGKIVPGEKGYRAQFAYPSEFRVSSNLAEHPELLAFGVPIVVDDSVQDDGTTSMGGLISLSSANLIGGASGSGGFYTFTGSENKDRTRTARRCMWGATFLNLGLAMMNFAFVGAHFFG
jgi:hypothetical protein